jgi:hypothetical protein
MAKINQVWKLHRQSSTDWQEGERSTQVVSHMLSSSIACYLAVLY